MFWNSLCASSDACKFDLNLSLRPNSSVPQSFQDLPQRQLASARRDRQGVCNGAVPLHGSNLLYGARARYPAPFMAMRRRATDVTPHNSLESVSFYALLQAEPAVPQR